MRVMSYKNKGQVCSEFRGEVKAKIKNYIDLRGWLPGQDSNLQQTG